MVSQIPKVYTQRAGTSTPERFAKAAITVSWRIIGQDDDSQGEMPHLLVCREQNGILCETVS